MSKQTAKNGHCKTPWRMKLLGATLLFPTMFLCACGAKAPPQRAIVFAPPEILLEDIQIPSRDRLKTVADMAELILADEEAMRMKNADLKALREYRALMTED